ncbi:MAG: lipid A deacylase LpxR family protein [Campylobacterales bacterium]|nr:lipid A deacylase LpxR family protein [Campylobacterales bacterium]
MRFLFLFLLSLLPLYSQIFSVAIDNDYVFHSDDHYTGGMQVGWMSDTYDYNISNWYVSSMSNMASLLKIADFDGKHQNASINLQEIIITPKNLAAHKPLYNDVPYVGILAANFSLFLWETSMFEEYKFSIGAVGSHSGGQQLQDAAHKIVGNSGANGWDNQIGDRVLLQAGYIKGIRQFEKSFTDGMGFEWFNNYFLDIGNIYTGAGFGSTVRYGYNMPKNFTQTGSLLNSSQNDQLNLDTYDKNWGWSLNAGVAVDGVGYSYLYDEAKRRGYEFDRLRIIPRGQLGIDFYTRDLRLSVELFPFGPTKSSFESNSFGRIALTWQMN